MNVLSNRVEKSIFDNQYPNGLELDVKEKVTVERCLNFELQGVYMIGLCKYDKVCPCRKMFCAIKQRDS